MTGPHFDPEPNAPERIAIDELDRAQRLIASLPGESDRQERLAAVGLLSAFVAHECRNRLTPIIGYARAASRTPNDPELVRKALTRIAASAQDLARFSELILSAAAPGHATTLVEEAWRGALDAVDLGGEGSTVGVTTAVEPGLQVAMSRSGLTHVLENLLRNAVEAGSSGLQISFAACSTRNTVSLYLVDSADGMDASLVDAAFEPLVSGGAGTGLGLTLCRYLVESAGGSLSIDSEPGEGTTILIQLPAPTDADADAPTPARAAKHPPG